MVVASPLPPDGEAGMIRRGLVKSNAKKGSQRKPILTVPGDGPGIETVFGQEFIEPGVKGMPLALGKLRVVDPHCLLPGCALAHCHTV